MTLSPTISPTPYNSSNGLPPLVLWGWEGWIVLTILFFLILSLIKNWVPADMGMVLAVACMMATQTVDTAGGLEGFCSSAVLAVAVLYVVAAGLTATGALDYLANKVLGTPKNLAIALFRLTVPVAVVSAFLNNTPVVAIMIPIIQVWARKVRLPVSQLFIPLSFASILGGTCTLIGTSTNLVVAGKAKEDLGIVIGLFDLGSVGVPVLFTGLAYIFLFTPCLLPDQHELVRRAQAQGLVVEDDASDDEGEDGEHRGPRDATRRTVENAFTLKCIVADDSPCHDQTVREAGLRGLSGLYVHGVSRGETHFSAVGPDFVLQRGDVLSFTGVADGFSKLCRAKRFVIVTAESDHRPTGASSASVVAYADPRVDKSPTHGPTTLPALEYPSIRDALQTAAADDAHLNSSTRLFRSDSVGSPSGAAPSARVSPLPGSSYDVGLPPPLIDPHAPSTRRVLSLRPEPDAHAQQTAEGRSAPSDGATSQQQDNFVHTAVIRAASNLVGKTPKEVDFRRTYSAAILSIQRAEGELETLRLGQTRLKIGDVLLLLASDEFDWDDEATERDLKPQFSTSQRETRALAVGGQKEFLIGMRVAESSALAGARPIGGRTVEQAGLRGLPGLFLVAIERKDGEILRAVGSDAVVLPGDTLYFVGERESVSTLRRIPGLEDPNADQVSKITSSKIQRRLVEAVISLSSELLHKTVREAKFRTKFDAAIIAVHRHGTRILARIGDIELEPGDVLILDTGPNFVKNYRNDPNFALVSEIENSTPPQFDKFYIALVASLAMMIAYVFASTYVDLVTLAILAASIMLFAGCLTPQSARESINWSVIVTIAAAFGISNAMEASGVAETFGNALVYAADLSGTGEIGLLCAVYFATFLLSTVVANNAAALLMFPIALRAASLIGADQTRMIYCLMLAASSSFMSPFGYQTNLMVFQPGNYVFLDFIRYGSPLQFWQMFFSITVLVWNEYWYYSWIVSCAFCCLAFAVAYKQKCRCKSRQLRKSTPHKMSTSFMENVTLGTGFALKRQVNRQKLEEREERRRVREGLRHASTDFAYPLAGV